MADIVLTEMEQVALRALLAIDLAPSERLPDPSVLAMIEHFVPSDTVGVCLADNRGHVVEEVTLPDLWHKDPDDHGNLPFYVGLMHWSKHPQEAEACDALPTGGDSVAMGFRNGPDHVAQVWWGREAAAFTEEDISRVRLLAPVLQRLLRDRPTAPLPGGLTPQERRVLMLVAGGRSNDEIARVLFVAQSTVRKHLENSYRKLGVHSRMAAVVALEGRQPVGDQRVAAIGRYA